MNDRKYLLNNLCHLQQNKYLHIAQWCLHFSLTNNIFVMLISAQHYH